MGSKRLSLLVILLWVGLQQQQGFIAASSVQVPPAAVLAATAQQPLLVTKPSTSQQHATAAETAAAAGDVLPGDPDPAGDAMIDWLNQNGGEVNVAVRRNVPGSGRGTFAPRAFQKGDVLARIPVEMAYALAESDESLAVSATYLMADMAEEDSPWGPYFNALPDPEHVWSTPHVPRSYFPIIQDEHVELAISLMQDNVDALWQSYESKYKKVLGPNVTPHNISHCMGLLLTRLFRFDQRDVLLPIVDMANHENTCLHSHLPEPCDPEAGYHQWKEGLKAPPLAKTVGNGVYGPHAASSSSSSSSEDTEGVSGQCIVWRAETDLVPGQEVCNSYKTLMQDRALLQYGFLQSGQPSLDLNMLDRHEHIRDLEHVWSDPPGATNIYGPRRFEGTPAQIHTEVTRLTARLKMLDDGEAAVAAIKRDASDPTGYHLSNMLEWRRTRKAAIVREIERLKRQFARLSKAQGAWSTTAAGQSGLEEVNKQLLSWLESNGAEVHVELRPIDTPAAQQTCSSSSSGSKEACTIGDAMSAPGPAPTAGVFTRKALQQGQHLAIVPVQLSYMVKPGLGKLDSALELMTDLLDVTTADASTTDTTKGSTADSAAPGSTAPGTTADQLSPLLRSLPPLGSVRSLYNFPPEYLPIVQQGRVERHIRRLQSALSTEYEATRLEIEAHDNSTTYAELQHAATLLVTRPLVPLTPQIQEQVDQEHDPDEDMLLLIPLFNNARHNSSCPHDYFVDTCPNSSSSSSSSSSDSSSSDLCFFWVAGTDLPADTEVCNSFGYLRSDQALLMYGMGSSSSSSSSSSEPLFLSGMDHMEATDDEPLAPIADEPLKLFTPGDRDEALTECVFLMELHQNRTNATTEANITAIQPVPSDPSSTLLKQLLSWRQNRIAAIKWELQRLSDAWNITQEELQGLLEQQQQQHADDTAGLMAHAGAAVLIDHNFSSHSSDPWQRMLDWMRHNGAVVNVNVTNAGPKYGRVVVTTAPTKRGDILATIPIDLIWNTAVSGGNGSMQLAAANLWAEMDDKDSLWRPYMDALPSEDEVVCPLVFMPPEYLPLLASEKAETFVKVYQEQIMEFWNAHHEDMVSKVPSVTLERFKYARALLATRLFGLSRGSSMIPLLDLANHANECPNNHVESPCPDNPDRYCIVWTAGAFIPEGAEACNGYKWMPNDRSMLQYGFLQSGPIVKALQTMDQPAANSSNIFQLFDGKAHGPGLFAGSAKETKAEVARLQSALHNLTALDAAAASTPAAASDKDGRMLAMLLTWRAQRKEALQIEIARLQKQLAVLEGREKEQKVHPNDALVQWLRQNGGQVNGLAVGSQAAAATASAAGTRPGLFATQSIKAGELMAVIPLEHAVPVNTGDLLVDTPVLFSDIHDPLDPRAPYFATLPGNADVLSYLEIPLEYGPVIQHIPTEDVLLRSNETMVEFLEDNPTQLQERNMTLAQLKNTLSLVASRLVTFPEGGHLVPLVDQANHQNGCKHSLAIKDCDKLSSSSSSSSSSRSGGQGLLNTTRLCIAWEAGDDLVPGDQVCMNHGWLLPDRMLLQFGYIPRELLAVAQQQQQEQQQQAKGGVSVPLFGMDRHDFKELSNGKVPWRYRLNEKTAPEPFAGNAKAIHYEIIRLELLADGLAAGDAAAAAVTPAGDDADGAILQQLQLWRQLRKLGIAQEIQRLKQQQEQQQQQPGATKDEL